jgi:hypothetical protein
VVAVTRTRHEISAQCAASDDPPALELEASEAPEPPVATECGQRGGKDIFKAVPGGGPLGGGRGTLPASPSSPHEEHALAGCGPAMRPKDFEGEAARSPTCEDELDDRRSSDVLERFVFAPASGWTNRASGPPGRSGERCRCLPQGR